MEILVRVVDKGPTRQHSQAGDVIAVCPDGWGWTQVELTNDDWRIVRVPILQTTADALLAGLPADSVLPFIRRINKIDIPNIPQAIKDRLTGPRQDAILTATRAQIVAVVLRKENT
jgi:hypothetical protein